MARSSEIKFNVELDENKRPIKINWSADDAGFDGYKECKSMMISLWDKEENLTLGVDLWTNEMLIDDMNIHFYQIFTKMADTYLKATNNNEAAKLITEFSNQFAGKLKLIKKVEKDQLK